MKLAILLLFFILSCNDITEKKAVKLNNNKFEPACTTYTDEAIIKILTKKTYHRDSVAVKILFENVMAKPYIVPRNLKLNFPLYPIITPAVEVKPVVDSMDYLFDTLGPGETSLKEFNISRYCLFKEGRYSVTFLFTVNTADYRNENLKGVKLSKAELLVD